MDTSLPAHPCRHDSPVEGRGFEPSVPFWTATGGQVGGFQPDKGWAAGSVLKIETERIYRYLFEARVRDVTQLFPNYDHDAVGHGQGTDGCARFQHWRLY